MLVRVATTLLLLLMGVGFASAAQTTAVKSEWYTIAAQPLNNGLPLFLTNKGNRVVLEPYRSGDPTQMWTTVGWFYPTLPPVTSDSGFDVIGFIGGMLKSFPHENGFHGSIPLVKIVSRTGGGCLILGNTEAKTVDCAIEGNDLKRQSWNLAPPGHSGMLSAPGGCLTEDQGKNPNFRIANGQSCGKSTGQQQFVVQLASELECKTEAWHLCFANGN